MAIVDIGVALKRAASFLAALSLTLFAVHSQAAVPKRFSPSTTGLFEENLGQYTRDVAFRGRFENLDALVHRDGSISLYPMQRHERQEMRLVHFGAAEPVAIEGRGQDAYRTNYFCGNGAAGAVDVPNFASVKIERLYPGIDLVLHSTTGVLEFDYLVAAGADPKAIRISFDAGTSVTLDPSGDLEIAKDGAVVHQRKPLAYQVRDGVKTVVDSKYALGEDGRVHLALGAYDPKLDLVIDPLIDYSSYLGGTSDDTPRGVRIGPSGYLYVAGTTTSSNFPPTAAYDSTLGGTSDAFITKIDPVSGKAVWSTYLGGANTDSGTALAVDSAGSAYVAGIAGSRFPTTSGAYQTSASGTYGFVTKLSPAGNSLVYSTLVSGAQPGAIEVDSQGEAVVVGAAGSSFVTTAGAFAAGFSGPSNASSGDAFVLKLNPTGTGAVFGTFFGGTGTDIANAVAIDATGQIVIGGSTQSVNMPLSTSPAPLQSALNGGSDGFAAILSANGATLHFSTYFGGSDFEEITAVALDPYGNVLVAGNTHSADYPTVTPLLAVADLSKAYVDAFTNLPTYQKGFLAKWSLGTSPSVVFSTYTGGRIDCCDSVQAMAVDANGDIYLSGTSRIDSFRALSSIFPYVQPFVVYNDYTTHGGTNALFGAAYLRDGSALRFQGYLAGCISTCNPSAITATGSGLVLVAGSTSSTWVPIAAANTQPVHRNPYVSETGFLTMLSFEPANLTLSSSDAASNTSKPVTLKAISSVPGTSGSATLWDGTTAIQTANAVEGIAQFTVTLPLGVRQLKVTLGSDTTRTLLMPIAISGGSCQ